MKKQPILLIILDGYGYSPEKEYNAVYLAKKPNINAWMEKYPHTLLKASGTAVGLPEGHMGNSEVGHMTIGAGRIIKQPITIINEMINDGSFFKNKTILDSFKKLGSNNALHIMGLLSDACVHSEIEQLYAYIKMATEAGLKNIVIHAFLDGRDTPPRSAVKYLSALDEFLQHYPQVKLGSVHGRFYAMDRDNNWNRIQQSYDTLTQRQEVVPSWKTILENNYDDDITDEFIPPTQITPHCTIKDGDGILFFNIRPDRARQLTTAFVQPGFNAFPTEDLQLAFFVTPVDYDKKLNTRIICPKETGTNTLKDVLAGAEKTMFSIAETEKYAHVTYFFSGDREETFANETHILIPSIKAKNYVDNPRMSADEITTAVLKSLKEDPKDFYLINYANADMVGHSGNLEATIKAVECLDEQLKKLYDVVIIEMDGTMYVTADHGNAEQKLDKESGQPSTAHTTNPVPFLWIKKDIAPETKLPLHQLSDIAPFILRKMGLPVPDKMKKSKN